MGRISVAKDSFTGANGASPDAQWTVYAGTPKIFSNSLRGEAANDNGVFNTGTFAADQYSRVTIAAVPSGDEIQAVVRCTDSANLYAAAYDGVTTVTVYKLTTAGGHVVLATRTVSYAIDDTMELEAIGAGTLTALRLYKNGVKQGADISVSTSFNDTGKPGVNLWRSGAGVTTARADAIDVGNVAMQLYRRMPHSQRMP